MVIKVCSYYKCQNRAIDGVPSGDFTMFGFPKDEERRKIWSIFGNVPNYDPKSKYFMCSDHFERKYIGVHNRRRLLYGEAKPIPYGSMVVESDGGNGGGEVVAKELKMKLEEVDKPIEFSYSIFEDQLVESTTKLSDYDDTINKTTIVSLNGKRPKPVFTYANKRKPKLPEETDIGTKIITFIYEGEEHVLMPKTDYMEKMKLVEELKRYKMFVNQIESNLTDLLGDNKNKI